MKAYVVQPNSQTEPMDPVRCNDESKELQLLLENNPNLLPGDQIDPEKPRRWLLVKSEMPVQHPETGEKWWSVDDFFVDQSGIPTFVECKRFKDTRSRREVVAQMIEYAANGHYYWTKSMIREYLTATALEKGIDLEEAIRALQPEFGLDVESFLEAVEYNLRQGQIRLVFFLEEAPRELKSIVEFLNNQMERTEVLIVEAFQFEKNGVRIVVPTLFGYQEEARLIKKAVTFSSRTRNQWDAESFFEDAEKRLSEADADRIRSMYKFLARNDQFVMRWGIGKTTGSINVAIPDISSKSLISIRSDGKIVVNFGDFSNDAAESTIQNRLADWAKTVGLAVPEDLDHRYPSYPIVDLADNAAEQLAKLSQLNN